MDVYGVLLYAAAIAVSSAALTAIVTNRFHKTLAGIVALCAGVCPWLSIAAFHSLLRGDLWIALGVYGSPPLYCAAFFLYGIGGSTPGRGIAAGAALTGMFAALGNTMFMFHLFSKMAAC